MTPDFTLMQKIVMTAMDSNPTSEKAQHVITRGLSTLYKRPIPAAGQWVKMLRSQSASVTFAVRAKSEAARTHTTQEHPFFARAGFAHAASVGWHRAHGAATQPMFARAVIKAKMRSRSGYDP